MTKPLHTISSTANMQVFGTTGAASATPSTGGWSSLSTTKTASFSAIQKEVVKRSLIPQAIHTKPTTQLKLQPKRFIPNSHMVLAVAVVSNKKVMLLAKCR